MKTRITELLKIKHPIIQAGMVWASGWKLASAVSQSGGFGLIGAGSMKPDVLRKHIKKCSAAVDKPFGVNLPLMRKDIDDLIAVTKEEKVKIVFTSAGHPGRYIEKFKSSGMTVVHVVSNVKQGLKAESVGCDAVVGEGVEAGGHNGKDEITTFTLIPQLADTLEIPVIAAGGIADGRGIIAALALGAEGVQIGTRFAATIESSAHENYKRKIIDAGDSDTVLIFKSVGMARVIKNKLSDSALAVEFAETDQEKLKQLLASKRERSGIFEGNEDEGMFEAGQCAGIIKEILPVKELFKKLIAEIEDTQKVLKNYK